MMAIQGVNRNGAYSVPYVKAEQDCGLQGCALIVCRKIMQLVSCLFKALCCCCCDIEGDDKPPRPIPPGRWPGRVAHQRSAKGLDLKLEMRTRDLCVLPLGVTLHQDVVLNIFSHWDMKTIVVTFSVVCKGWYELAKTVYIKQLGSKRCLTMQELAICEREIYRPQLTTWRKYGGNSYDWNGIFKHCGQLEALDFSNQGNVILGRFPSGIFKLEELQFRTAQQVPLVIKIAAAVCPHFKILNFSNCTGLFEIYGQLLNALDLVPKLTHLNLAGCDLSADQVYEFVKRLPNLISLEFGVKEGAYLVQDLNKIAECRPKLQRLKISKRGDLSVFGILCAVEKFPCLTHLSIDITSSEFLTRNDRIANKEAILARLPNCTSLVFFHFTFLEDFTEEELIDLREQLPNLEITGRNANFFLD
jgi:hypothetical protein